MSKSSNLYSSVCSNFTTSSSSGSLVAFSRHASTNVLCFRLALTVLTFILTTKGFVTLNLYHCGRYLRSPDWGVPAPPSVGAAPGTWDSALGVPPSVYTELQTRVCVPSSLTSCWIMKS